MKKSNLKVVLLFFALVVAGAAIYSCKKSTTTPDPNLSIVVSRQLVISALNTYSGDSIGQFTAAITTPTTTLNQTATGNTIVIKDPVAGNYSIVVSKTGFTTSVAKTITVVLPTDAKSSLKIKASVGLSQVAAPVVVTSSAGGAIPVNTFAGVASSAVVADVTVAPATVFTLADGSKPTSVSISVTNVPVATATLPATNNTVVATSVPVVKNQVPIQTLDLQPEGMTFDKPMVIDMNIANLFPASMSVAQKTAYQNALTLNYVKKDGTVEVITPDHFSADRNTVYYKISHFSTWVLTNSAVISFVQIASTEIPFTPAVNPTCGATLAAGSFTESITYTNSDATIPNLAWILTNRSDITSVTYPVTVNFDAVAGVANTYAGESWSCSVDNYLLTVQLPGSTSTIVKTISVPNNSQLPHPSFSPCHN